VEELLRLSLPHGFEPVVRPFTDQPFEPIPGLQFEPIHVPHDWAGTHAFVIEGFGCRIGYATDLGRVTDELIERFCDLDLLAVESNYDRRMQFDSARPWFLKQRITGGRGHLSNEQALEFVKRVLTRCERLGRRLPEHVVLLHRSLECNCPRLVRDLFTRDARIAPRLVLAEQYERTPWLRARREQPFTGEQLALAWG
jgi:phosphoribosyl 1,2-cyclic phosphodiesterase